MWEKSIDIGCVAAWALWGAAVALLGVAALDTTPPPGHLVGAMIATAAALTFTVRLFFVAQSRMIRQVFTLTAERECPTCHAARVAADHDGDAARVRPIR